MFSGACGPLPGMSPSQSGGNIWLKTVSLEDTIVFPFKSCFLGQSFFQKKGTNFPEDPWPICASFCLCLLADLAVPSLSQWWSRATMPQLCIVEPGRASGHRAEDPEVLAVQLLPLSLNLLSMVCPFRCGWP